MENYKAIQLLEHIKNFGYCSGEARIAVNEGIRALEFETRARESAPSLASVYLLMKFIPVPLTYVEEAVY